MDKVPDIHLFTVSIEEMNPMTIELNAKVEAIIPELIDRIYAHAKNLHLQIK